MNYDFVIIGGGVIGLSVARELIRQGYKNIAVFEKEKKLGVHASGKNSGVIHAGLYYAQDSNKLKFCKSGAELLYAYAEERKIPFKKNGKVVVATSENEHRSLLRLYENALKNKVTVEKIDRKQLWEIEPLAKTYQEALWSPNTGLIDSKNVLHNLSKEIQESKVKILLQNTVRAINWTRREIVYEKEKASFGHFINCAGMNADLFAHSAGVGLQHRILPFRGCYRELKTESELHCSIYPVPDSELPFLGVHATPTLDAKVLIGPNAMPAFGRENYWGVSRVSFWESVKLTHLMSLMFFKNSSNLRSHITNEIALWRKSSVHKVLEKMMKQTSELQLSEFRKVGLRSQLVNLEKMKFEMDFVIESGENSTHVLNAVSPGFTSSFAFAKEVCHRALNS